MIFSRLFYRKRSGKVARERLQILLVTDRLGCNPDTTEAIKNDIDVENCHIEIQHEKGPCLMANIPIKEIKI